MGGTATRAARLIVSGPPATRRDKGRRRGRPSLRSFSAKGAAHYFLCLPNDGGKMVSALQALGVKLVNVLCARRARGEPAAARDNLQAANRSVVSGGAGEFSRDRFACDFRGGDSLR